METIDFYNPEICESNPDKIYVFGDNLISSGCGGQAIIRNCKNAFGIPTKRKPTMNEDSFFSDSISEFRVVEKRLQELLALKKSGKKIVFPTDGLGTGFAMMPEKSPRLFEFMNEFIEKNF